MKYKKQFLWGIMIFMLFIINVTNYAQLPEFSSQRGSENPRFFYKLYRTVSHVQDTCKITFFMSVPYDELQFVNQDSIYNAGYELTLTILDMQDNVIETRIINKNINVQFFRFTNSRKRFSTLNEVFFLPPGEYKIIVELMDVDSRSVRIVKEQVNINDYFNIPFSMSDVLFLTKQSQEGRSIYIPNLVANYTKDQREIYLKFDVFNNKRIDSVDIKLVILSSADKPIKTYNYKKNLEGFKTTILLEVIREELISGNYLVQMEIKGDKHKIENKLKFSVNWMSMTNVSSDIHAAIEQLKYIAPSKEIRNMERTENIKKKEALFNEFWNTRDPTPSTEINELKKEYYDRVAYANRNFSDSRKGWLTDRGEVYIVLGPPDDVKRYPNMINSKPYEVWNYYRFGSYLVFVDYTGLDDYRLTPKSWDKYNLIRNRY